MERKRRGIFFLLIALAALQLLAVRGMAAQEGEAAHANESCITAKCHAAMGKASFVHGPVAVGECAGCHKKTGAHKFEPIANAGKLCRECHEKKLGAMKVVHLPVAQGKCTKCHDPHQSAHKFQLRAGGSELCFLCHNRSMVGGNFLHGAVAGGGCNTCHATHESDNPKLLLENGNAICFTCHTDKVDAFKGKKFMHAPVEQSCVKCHNPHSSNFKFTLKAEGNQDLCFGCHTDKARDVARATVPHRGLQTERRCLACHDAHVADFPKQLSQTPMDLCLSCHDREYSSQNGATANIKALLTKNSVHHGPIQQRDCSGCHNTHGSSNFRMLRENYPQLFYAPYSPDNYKLCFMCHQNTIASEKTTVTLTGFRNGNQNLHFVHVNKAAKGRTCRACHDAHATNNPKHIRNAVPFAKWQLPVAFNKSATGGTCQPGCHQPFSYDRNKPVVNKPALQK